MRLHRFYIEGGNLNDHVEKLGPLSLTDKGLIHQLRSVFRFKAGQEIILFDGSGSDFLAVIKNIADGHLQADIKEKIKDDAHPRKEIILYQALIKKAHFELIAEKATEIGVSRIVPVISERSEKKGLNMERMRKIAIEASEQSGRKKLPAICEIVSFKDMLGSSGETLIAFHPVGEPFHAFTEKIKNKGKASFGICIGPEGGWSEREIDLMKEKGIGLVSLGDQTLRAETAAIAALALLLL